MLHALRFFSSKCRLFHNATFFGSCIIHILHTGVLKFTYQIPVQKVKVTTFLICFLFRSILITQDADAGTRVSYVPAAQPHCRENR